MWGHSELLVVALGRLRRIMEQPRLHHRLLAPSQEEVLTLAKTGRQDPQQPLAQSHGAIEIGFCRHPQPRVVGGPTVRAMQRPPSNDVRVIERQIQAIFEALLEVGCVTGMLVYASRHEASAEALVDRVLDTLLKWQRKVTPRRRERGVDHRLRDAVIDDVKESNRLARMAQLARKRINWRALDKPAEIKNRHLRTSCR